MSIINDALKKVQDNLDKKNLPQKPTKPEFAQKTEAPANEPAVGLPPDHVVHNAPQEEFIPAPLMGSASEDKVRMTESIEVASGRDKTIVTLCFVICAILIGSILYLMEKFSYSRPESSAVRVPATPSPIAIVQPPLAPSPNSVRRETPRHHRSSSDLVLSGIIAMDQGHVALINNEIYEVGAMVEDWEITNISLDQVELKNSQTEETRTLRVSP